MLYSLMRPALFTLAPETAHRLAIFGLQLMPETAPPAFGGPLATRVAGLDFANPVGLAAGFDKDGEAPDAAMGQGFGFAEIGSITPLPQSGNPRPRLFRLEEDRAVINRMGFNNRGAEAALARLLHRDRGRNAGVLGINIGANKDSADRVADYALMARLMAPHADYLAINISSPNTPGLRELQGEGALDALLDAILQGRSEAKTAGVPPVFLKVAPDLTPGEVDSIARSALDKQLGALIVANTTIDRPALTSKHAHEAGGLSGAPLKAKALDCLRTFRMATGSGIPLIGVGGIATAEDAWSRIRAGASLVQLYSAMIYEGPGIARTIAAGLTELMRRDGFASIAEAVGSE